MQIKITLMFLVFALLYAVLVHAGMDEAVIAYRKGDYAVALQEFGFLAQQGNADAQIQLGVMNANGQGVPKNDVQAILWFRKAAEQGSATAQFNLGLMYDLGRGIAQNYTLASEWYRKAADQGHAGAQQKLGFLYYSGNGFPQDYVQALTWFRKAAIQGNATAQTSLGIAFYSGQGTSKDYTQAIAWFRKASEQGDATAQNALGIAYDEGNGVPQDFGQAVFWYRKAAEQGNAGAQNNLGAMYYKGTGVPQNYTQAQAWFRKAAEQGNVQAKNSLSNLKFERPVNSEGTRTEPARPTSAKPGEVIARGVSVVPGAIVCPNAERVDLMFSWYSEHVMDNFTETVTKGQLSLQRDLTPIPIFERYGCTLVPAGTPMTLERVGAFSVVTVKLPNGKFIKGVTLPNMFR